MAEEGVNLTGRSIHLNADDVLAAGKGNDIGLVTGQCCG
jgi:hypothetical protein